MRAATVTLLILGGIPLLVYPFVALAGVMSLAGHRAGDESWALLAVSRAFLLGSLAYPAVFVACLIVALMMRKQQKERPTLTASAGPLVFLGLPAGLFTAWSYLE